MFIFKEAKSLCEIWGSHGGDYEDRSLLACDAV
jgi:hypothetical protein